MDMGCPQSLQLSLHYNAITVAAEKHLVKQSGHYMMLMVTTIGSAELNQCIFSLKLLYLTSVFKLSFISCCMTACVMITNQQYNLIIAS